MLCNSIINISFWCLLNFLNNTTNFPFPSVVCCVFSKKNADDTSINVVNEKLMIRRKKCASAKVKRTSNFFMMNSNNASKWNERPNIVEITVYYMLMMQINPLNQLGKHEHDRVTSLENWCHQKLVRALMTFPMACIVFQLFDFGRKGRNRFGVTVRKQVLFDVANTLHFASNYFSTQNAKKYHVLTPSV